MQHLKYLAMANYAFAALFTLIFGLAAVLMGVASVLPMVLGEAEIAALVGPLVGFGSVSCFGTLFVLLYLIAGRRVRKGRGRILQTVLAVLNLGSVPLGTAYGGYALWVLWMNEESKKIFDEPYGLIE